LTYLWVNRHNNALFSIPVLKKQVILTDSLAISMVCDNGSVQWRKLKTKRWRQEIENERYNKREIGAVRVKWKKEGVWKLGF
jgi:hypothetical protein